MAQDKELLLKDLCARLPYRVKCHFKYGSAEGDITLDCIDKNVARFEYGWHGRVHVIIDTDFIKPYLFPLSSMTEEQKSYINGRWGVNEHFEFEIGPLWGEYFVDVCDAVDFINWCYENHFDINGLIPRGLAEDAADKNIY